MVVFLMIDQIFHSEQKKASVIIKSKHGKYNFPCSLSKDLRSYGIRKYQANLKTSKSYCLVLSLLPKMKTLSAVANQS